MLGCAGADAAAGSVLDCPCLVCAGYFSTCTGNEEQPEEPYWAKWAPFVAMFRKFYGDTPGVSMTPDQPWSFFEMPELEAVVAALNSTMRESHRDDDHYGWVGEKQLRWFAEQLEPYRQRGWWRLAAIHHNVRRGPVRDDENLRDGERFRERLGPQVNAVFHGHTHDGKLDWLSQKVPILATGSAAVKETARPPEVPTQYQVVRFWPDRFRRWTRMYVPGGLRWVGDTSASPGGDSWQTEEQVMFDLPAAPRRCDGRPPRAPTSAAGPIPRLLPLGRRGAPPQPARSPIPCLPPLAGHVTDLMIKIPTDSGGRQHLRAW